jgi:DNA-binding XRE family transcriptional regulator
MNLTAAADSGLTQTELAQVLGVSRVTVNLWLNGKMKPHRYNAENVRRRLELLHEALKRNLIPKPNPRRKPRHEAIKSAIERVEQSLAAA